MEEKLMIELEKLSVILDNVKPPFMVKKTKFGYYKVDANGIKGKMEIVKNKKGEDIVKYFFGKYSGVIIPNFFNGE